MYLEKDGSGGLAMARDEVPDLVVLDLLIAGLSGVEVYRARRRDSDVPIIMLTAMGTEQNKLDGLDLGRRRLRT